MILALSATPPNTRMVKNNKAIVFVAHSVTACWLVIGEPTVTNLYTRNIFSNYIYKI